MGGESGDRLLYQIVKYHKIMISANVISTGYGILESIKIHIENCCWVSKRC